jgi:hypothetical protein
LRSASFSADSLRGSADSSRCSPDWLVTSCSIQELGHAITWLGTLLNPDFGFLFIDLHCGRLGQWIVEANVIDVSPISRCGGFGHYYSVAGVLSRTCSS